MATVDLGKIKFVWRGAYNNITAYTPDDVVSSGGSSYICIAASTGNAVSNGTYWNLLAQTGTDVGTTLTTQGDILYRSGSGLARLGYGTSGNVLTTKGSGQNPVWEAASGGKVLQAVTGTSSTANTTTSTSFTDTGLNVTITPSATSSKILVMAHTTGVADTSNQFSYFTIERKISGGSNTNIGDSSTGLTHLRGDAVQVTSVMCHALDTPSTTSAITYEFQFKTSGGGNTVQCMYQGVKSNITVLEIGA